MTPEARAIELVRDWKDLDDHVAIDAVRAIAHEIRAAEERGMERAATIADLSAVHCRGNGEDTAASIARQIRATVSK